MPMSEFDYCDWNGDTVNDRFYGKQMQVVQFGMGNYKRQAGSVIWFDEMGFTGDFSASSGSGSSKPSGGTTSHVQSSAVSSTASPNQSQASSDISSDTSVTDSSTESEEISSGSSASSSDTEAKTENSGSLLWLWITSGAVAAVGVGAGCWYFLYFKKKHGTEE